MYKFYFSILKHSLFSCEKQGLISRKSGENFVIKAVDNLWLFTSKFFNQQTIKTFSTMFSTDFSTNVNKTLKEFLIIYQ